MNEIVVCFLFSFSFTFFPCFLPLIYANTRFLHAVIPIRMYFVFIQSYFFLYIFASVLFCLLCFTFISVHVLNVDFFNFLFRLNGRQQITFLNINVVFLYTYCSMCYSAVDKCLFYVCVCIKWMCE